MLSVKPAKNNSTEEIKTLICRDGEEQVGYVKLRQYGYIIEVVDIAPNPLDPAKIRGETFAVLDTIIRALGSYALNRSCFYVESSAGSIFPTLSKLRFSLQDGKMKSDLSKLLVQCH